VHHWIVQYSDNGREIVDLEKDILKTYAADRYTGPDILIGRGRTEMFTRDILQLDAEPTT
jgi:hypothetical protein